MFFLQTDQFMKTARGWTYRLLDACTQATDRTLLQLGLRQPPPLGEAGEREAASYLGRLGYHIVGRGVHERLGELDIVAIDDRTMVYVEVKTRRDERNERPGAAVDDQKKKRICLAAAAYAERHQVDQCPSRFDIVEVVWPNEAKHPTIRHWPAAFESVLDD